MVATKPTWEIPVIHRPLKDLTILVVFVAIFCIVLGTPLLVTGAYYYSWNKVYDVTGGCAELMQVTADSPLPDLSQVTPTNMTIAYVGNSGATNDSLKVYQMIVDQGVEAVIHLGNFDMCDDSALFGHQLDEVLGDIPFIPVIGNNDLHVWGDYQQVLSDRFSTSDYLQCNGTLFVNYWCVYRGLFIAFSSVGTKCGDGYSNHTWHENELRNQLDIADSSAFTGNWVTCAWHKNQHNLQIGEKSDEVGYEMYNICAQHGALTVTGHDFSYARTQVMTEFNPQTVDTTCENNNCAYALGTGRTIVANSGLGGFIVDEVPDDDLTAEDIWASTYSGKAGALICKYNFNGIANLAYCYFMTADEEVIDEFFFTRGTGVIAK